MPPHTHKFQRQKFEYHCQCKRLKTAEHRFRHDIQNQLQARAERRQAKLAAGVECSTEELATGLEQLRMTDNLRGQLAYLRRLRRTMKLPDPTPESIVRGA